MILRGAQLVTLDPPAVELADLRLVDGRIAERQPALAPLRGETVVDVPGRMVMPGLVNGHTHLYSALARGMPPPARTPRTFVEILERVWWRLDRALTIGDVEVSALMGGIEAALSGTTFLVDHHSSPSAIAGSLNAVRSGLEQVGLRSVLCYEVTDRNGRVGRDAGIAENVAFQQAAQGPLTRGMIGAHASFTLEDETLTRLAEALATTGSSLHVHVAEDRADVDDCQARFGSSVPERLRKAGLLGSRTLCAHCVHLSAEEMQKVSSLGGWIAHNPRSNMNNHVGHADAEGLTCAVLGTDGMDGDMFAEARAAFLKMRDVGRDDAFDAALRLLAGGHRLAAALFGLPFGKLDAGAPADLVVLEYDPPTPLTADNLGGHLLFGIDRSHVQHVLVAGEWVVRDRRIARLDAGVVRARARQSAASLWERMARL
jgi:putative selenium metabolism protein SsnA